MPNKYCTILYQYYTNWELHTLNVYTNHLIGPVGYISVVNVEARPWYACEPLALFFMHQTT